MPDLDKKQADRLKFLNLLYEHSRGDRHYIESMYEIGKALGLDKPAVDSTSQYLEGEGLLEYKAIGGGVSITHWGVKTIEAALSTPEQSTKYFPPVFNVINVGHMSGSQIQQGSVGSTQNIHGPVPVNEISEIISLTREHLEALQLSQDQVREIKADLGTLEAQLGSSRPKRSILHESLDSMRTILENAAGTVVANQISPLIISVLSGLGS